MNSDCFFLYSTAQSPYSYDYRPSTTRRPRIPSRQASGQLQAPLNRVKFTHEPPVRPRCLPRARLAATALEHDHITFQSHTCNAIQFFQRFCYQRTHSKANQWPPLTRHMMNPLLILTCESQSSMYQVSQAKSRRSISETCFDTAYLFGPCSSSTRTAGCCRVRRSYSFFSFSSRVLTAPLPPGYIEFKVLASGKSIRKATSRAKYRRKLKVRSAIYSGKGSGNIAKSASARGRADVQHSPFTLPTKHAAHFFAPSICIATPCETASCWDHRFGPLRSVPTVRALG